MLLAARNLLKAWLLLGGFITAFAALGWWLGGLRLASVFFVVCLLMAATVYWYGPRIVLASIRARELTLAEATLLHTTLERLAVRAGVVRPRLYLLPSGHPHAISVGRGVSASAVGLSQGLIAALPPAELEGVIAHQLAKVRHRDVVVETPVAVLAGWLVEASRIGGWLERILLFLFAPLAASLVQVLLSPRREFAADRRAADICESPHGLADALIRLEQANELVEFRASPVTEPLYTVSPFEPVGLAAMFSTHPPIGERVARLRALDPEWREKLRAA
ncbi:MAG TPA: M48 family metalloprotease [Gaiellaceae bacterium]|nr:M48 family metalloprotease [Gaiellaceae bacterium]